MAGDVEHPWEDPNLTEAWRDGDSEDPWEDAERLGDIDAAADPVDTAVVEIDPDDTVSAFDDAAAPEQVDDAEPDDAVDPTDAVPIDGGDPWVDQSTPTLVDAGHFDLVLDDDTEVDQLMAPVEPPPYAEIFDEGLVTGDDVDTLGIEAHDGGPWIDVAVLGPDDGSGTVPVGGLDLADELGVPTADGDADVAAGLWDVLLDGEDPDAQEMARAALLLLDDGAGDDDGDVA